MQTRVQNHSAWPKRRFITKTVLVMKLTSMLILGACLLISAKGFSQTITFSGKNVSLQTVFSAIKKQTGYAVMYNADQLGKSKPVNVKAVNVPLENFLKQVLNGQPFEYAIENTTIFISAKPAVVAPSDRQPKLSGTDTLMDVKGSVTDENGEPLAGASIRVKGTSIGTASDAKGRFTINAEPAQTLVITYTGYQEKEVQVGTASNLSISLLVSNNPLNEIVVVGYGESKRRDLVGAVTRITANDIARQPVNNLLSSLQGMAPGLEITNTSGTPGSAVNVRIRGINSVNGSAPLILVDNVPADLSSVAPSDVASVEILKDASATAIYGARGSNGVILVTTKRGRSRKAQISLQAYSSITNPTKTSPVLNTDQYIMLRKEGYKNDNIAYTPVTAPDLFMDNTVNTNWADKLYKPALTQDYQLNFSGGSNEINYFFSGGVRNEDATVKGDWYSGRYNIRTGIDAKISKRLAIGGGLAYTYTKSNIYNGAVAATIYYALPLIPYLDADAKTNLAPYNAYVNPNRQLTAYNTSKNNQLLGNVYLDYNIWDKLSFRTDVSFRSASGKTLSFSPTTSFQTDGGFNSGSYGFSDGTTINVEPKLNYEKTFGSHYFKLLAGGTYLKTSSSSTNIFTYTAANAIDALNTIVTGTVAARNYSEEPYKFASFFGRVNYKFKDRYLVEGVLRRDGSSRFGPDNKYGTFWSVGAGYVITDEPIIKTLLGENVFAKIRASYGTTGTDGIGAFRYVSTSPVTSAGYMDNTTISVGNLANASLKWEETKKFDVGLDISLLDNRIGITADYYKSRTNGMLYSNSLSYVTGFNSITQNMPGLVDNNGYEFSLNLVPVSNGRLKWSSTFNISFIKNKLVSLPALANATFGNKYIYKVGAPLDLIWGFNYQGVDPETGLAKFEDVDNNGGITIYSPDYQVIGKNLPDFFGGWNNVINYKGFDFTIFSQFVKGISKNYNVYSGVGDVYNSPVTALNRWQTKGDITDIPRAAAPGTAAATNNNKVNQSNFAYDDASYFRVKNITLGYTIPTKHSWISDLRVYATGYNLFTISGFKGDDPEGYSNVVPMVKSYTMGLNVTF